MDSSGLNRIIFSIGRHCRCLLLLSLLFHRSIHPFTLSSAIWIGTNARIISNSHHFDLPKFRSVLMDYQKLIFFRTRTNNEIRKHSACNFRNNKNNLWKRGCLKLNTVKTLTLLLFSVPKLMCIPTLYWSFILKIYQDRAELQEVKVMEFLIIWRVCPNSKWRDTTASKGQSATASKHLYTKKSSE